MHHLRQGIEPLVLSKIAPISGGRVSGSQRLEGRFLEISDAQGIPKLVFSRRLIKLAIKLPVDNALKNSPAERTWIIFTRQ
jgi:hypothetical protein